MKKKKYVVPVLTSFEVCTSYTIAGSPTGEIDPWESKVANETFFDED